MPTALPDIFYSVSGRVDDGTSNGGYGLDAKSEESGTRFRDFI